jgi:hypothetical protein
MIRRSVLVLAVVLLGAAACSSPTGPSAAKKPTPSGPLMECIGGWETQSGTPC